MNTEWPVGGQNKCVLYFHGFSRKGDSEFQVFWGYHTEAAAFI